MTFPTKSWVDSGDWDYDYFVIYDATGPEEDIDDMLDFVQCAEVFYVTPTIRAECWREQGHAPFLGCNYHEGQIDLVGNRGAIVSWLSPSSTACATA